MLAAQTVPLLERAAAAVNVPTDALTITVVIAGVAFGLAFGLGLIGLMGARGT